MATEPGKGSAPESSTGVVRLSRDQLWPWLIGVGLALVVLVNALFIWIAVSGADDVAQSYNEEER